MNVKRERKITFVNVGVIDVSRIWRNHWRKHEAGVEIWRNHETGVEIFKSECLDESGRYLFHVFDAAFNNRGRIMVKTATTFAEALACATAHAARSRAYIADAHTLAHLEYAAREAARLAAIRDVVARRGPLADIPGAIPGGLCVRDTAGREHVTMRIPAQPDQRVTLTSGASYARDDVATWTVVANFRP